MGGAVIELGYAPPWEPEPDPPPRWPPRIPKWLAPAAVAVVTLLALGAAGEPKRWDPVLTLREQNTSLRFGSDDTAYVTTQRSRSARLQAYRPGRGGARWTVNFPGGYPVPAAAPGPDLLTLTVYDTDPDGQGAGNAVQGRDPRTGAPVWTRAGVGLLGLGPDVAVVTNRQEGGGSVPGPRADAESDPTGEDSEVGRIEAVDRRTGDVRWARPVAADVIIGTEQVGEGGAPHIVELAGDGQLRLSDMRTGATRRETRLDLIGAPLHVSVTGAVVTVLQERAVGAERVLVAYDLGAGRPRPAQGDSTLSACGDGYECVAGNGTLTITHAATGAVRFQGRGDQHLITGDRLIVSWQGVLPEPSGTQVYDLRTGRRLQAYRGWLLATFTPAADVMYRATPDRTLTVATVDHRTGRLEVVGRAADWSGAVDCTRGPRYLGCVGATGLTVWRLPRV